MKSAVAYSEEIDDANKACAELVRGIGEKLELGSSSIGILFCDADVEVAELGAALHRELKINIVGTTTTASFDRVGGYHDMGIVLMVITADDVDIVVGHANGLTKDMLKQQIQSTYIAAEEELGVQPKLIYLCAPYIATITSDNYLNIVDEASGHVPIFGGVSTDHYDLQYQQTFVNGVASQDGLVMVLFGGNIRPVFAMRHEFGGKIEGKVVITQSTDNQVERVGDKTFLEYITSIMAVPEGESVVYHFQSTPFVMEMPDYAQDEQPIVRALSTIHHDTGAGGFLSNMPEGSVLSFNYLDRNNLCASTNNTLDVLLSETQKHPDYKYRTILANSCNARHLMMGDTKDMESDIITKKLECFDEELNAIGYYAFGEMCPTAVSSEGAAKNRFHNISFAVCAF